MSANKNLVTNFYGIVIVQLVILSSSISCLKSREILNSNEWKTVTASSFNRLDQARAGKQEPIVSGGNLKSVKLIEWDDDDNFFTNEIAQRNRSRPKFDEAPFFIRRKSANKALPEERKKTTDYQTSSRNKLIYHGQLAGHSAVKIIDGLKVAIDTHRPVEISRRAAEAGREFLKLTSSSTESTPTTTSINYDKLSYNYWSKETSSKHESQWPRALLDSNELESNALEPARQENRSKRHFQLQELSSSSTSWRPINVAYSSAHWNNKQLARRNERSLNKSAPSEPNSADQKPALGGQNWKPVLGESGADSSKSDGRIKLPSVDSIRDRKLARPRGASKSARTTSATARPRQEAVIVYGKKVVNNDFDANSAGELEAKQAASINEPFEDTEMPDVITRDDFGRFKAPSSSASNALAGKQREPKAMPESEAKVNKWKPVAVNSTTQTPASYELVPITMASNLVETNPSSLANSTTGNGNSSNELAHRSASDLNYIYSSQPVQVGSSSAASADWQQRQQAQTASSSNYYANYVMQPKQEPQQHQQIVEPQPIVTDGGQAIVAPIIDTTSGQLPEMIVDRQPMAPAQQFDQGAEYYSVPQQQQPLVGNNFQPVVSGSPQPVRIPSVPMTYNDNAYNAVNSYYGPSLQVNRAPQVQPAQFGSYASRSQPATTTSAPQVVRQEHHYHYYSSSNNNQQPQFDRSQSFQQSTTTTPAPIIQQNIIREIQPLLISNQPIVQQQQQQTTSSTTPAPVQIIREIIKEVPAQSLQVQIPRIVIPQQQQQQQQTLLDSTSYSLPAMNSAQRVIRQLSSSMPSVSVRMPPVLQQIKLPALQALQILNQPLTTRLQQQVSGNQQQQQSVTRQTGTFIIPPVPKKTTTYLTETQAMPTHTTIMHTTQFTPATRTTVYTTDHQQAQPSVLMAAAPQLLTASSATSYKA